MKTGLGGFRLVDAAMVAAIALLALKGVGLLSPPAPVPDGDVASGFARVLTHARTNHVPADPTTTGSVPEKKPATEAVASSRQEPVPAIAAETVPGSPSERAILERLGERRDALQQRAREMETRGRVLDEAERRLESRLGELRRLDAQREAGPAAAKVAEAAGLKTLATMYETMKPKEAARVFERLPHDVLIPVVRQTNPRKMAEILAAMSPDSAEKLTIALARSGGTAGGAERSAAAAGLPPGELPGIELPSAPPGPPP